MPEAMAFVLVHEMKLEVRVFEEYIILDLIAKVSHHQDEFPDTGIPELVDDNAKDGLARQRDQGLGLCICMGPELRSCTRHRNNRFHLGNLVVERVKIGILWFIVHGSWFMAKAEKNYLLSKFYHEL
jgi:hypothetical protein